jgi:hypothetical protein
MTNQSKAWLAGLTGRAGAMLFTFYFIGINPLLNLFSSPFSPKPVAPTHMSTLCIAGIYRHGNPAGLVIGKDWTKTLAKFNPSKQ